MTNRVDAEAIAAGLSEAQRRGLLAWKDCSAVGPTSNILYDFAVCNIWDDPSSGMACGAEEFPALIRTGVLACSPKEGGRTVDHPQGFEVVLDHDWRITPLGLAVRDVLMKEKG